VKKLKKRKKKRNGVQLYGLRDSELKKIGKCKTCKGWINPPWERGDGDYRHCECKK
jgi:hypothetical protein